MPRGLHARLCHAFLVYSYDASNTNYAKKAVIVLKFLYVCKQEYAMELFYRFFLILNI